MRTCFLTLALLAICTLAIADIGPFTPLGTGFFAGEMASYASGDTIIYVYNESSSSDPTQVGHIILKFSTDGGLNWISRWITEVTNCLTQPTLNVTPEELLVSYTDGATRRLAFATIGDDQGVTLYMGQSFENSPIIEKREGEFRCFALDMPFPQYDQDSYTLLGDPEEFPGMQEFTHEFKSMNDNNVYYTGTDVIQGTVRSNSHIRIKQAGGGANGGWPTFLSPVIISGDVISIPETYPLEEIFQGGLIEHAPILEYDPLYTAMADGMQFGPLMYDPNIIVKITVTGNTYTGMLGTISYPEPENAFVYTLYPAEYLGDPLFSNTYSVADTVWIPMTGGTCHSVQFTRNKLWIEGNFAGNQTWCTTDTMMIIGDITLAGTIPGYAPDYDPVNTTDMVNLIAGETVLLKYGYRDPVNSTRVHPLCRADNDPIRIYASIYALGQDSTNPRKDGMFSFEYQHPHPAVPTVLFGNYMWPNIDLHRRKFPQTSSAHWPANIDYPWYNPLWPENQPYNERGTIQLWGSVNQYRRGYVHRNVLDNENVTYGIWDPENDACGGTSNVNYTDAVTGLAMNTRNFPGTTGGGVGYKKDYHWDSRIKLNGSTNIAPYKVWKLGINLSVLTLPGAVLPSESYHRYNQSRKTHSKAFARNGDLALYATNDILLKSEGDAITDLSAVMANDGNIQSAYIGSDGSPWIYQMKEDGPQFAMSMKKLNPSTGAVDHEVSLTTCSMLNAATIMPDGRLIYAVYQPNGNIKVWELSPGNVEHEIATWFVGVYPAGDPVLTYSRLYLIPSAQNELEIFLCPKIQTNSPQEFYHAHASFPVSTSDPSAPVLPAISWSSYPNPMRDQLTLKLELSAPATHRIDIFNIRGQKITSLPGGNIKSGKLEYTWNGNDDKGRSCAPGIYLIKLYVNDRPMRSKRICRIGA